MDMTWGNEQGSGLIIALDQMSSERAKRLSIKDPERQLATRDAQLLFVQIHKKLKECATTFAAFEIEDRKYTWETNAF